MYNKFSINKNIIQYVNNCESKIVDSFVDFEKVYEYNQLKVLNSFISNKLSESDLQESTGYGYTDIGRDKIERIFSDIFCTEDALVRQQITSGTHAISLSLFALTRPGDNILSISGLPYDTLHSTIGLNNECGSLKEYGIFFDYVDLVNNDFDYDKIKDKIVSKKTRLVMIQRSRGYSERSALSIDSISKVISFIKNIDKEIIVFVDNCYGEFVDKREPSDVGADIVAGSLIKNPGGSLAKSGGYIVGKKDLIEKCAIRLTAPGLGKEVGINFNQNRNTLQGLYFAPQLVFNSLKVAKLYAYVFNELGYDTVPMYNEPFNDIVIAIKIGDENKLLILCESIQETSPVDSFVRPVSNDMPGYDSKVVMACGSFVAGSSIELSCDAPIRKPYIAFLQGGITYFQGKLSLMKALSKLNIC